jgi:hypothetical protein
MTTISTSDPRSRILMDVSRAQGLAEGLSMSLPGGVREGSVEEIADEIAQLLNRARELTLELVFAEG